MYSNAIFNTISSRISSKMYLDKVVEACLLLESGVCGWPMFDFSKLVLSRGPPRNVDPLNPVCRQIGKCLVRLIFLIHKKPDMGHPEEK